MSTDWNQKLAWVLRDLPEANFDLLQLSGHRSNLLGDEDVACDVGTRADWLVSGADRVPFPTGRAGARVQVDWGEHPEVTHPAAKQRFAVDAIDLEQVRKAASALLDEASQRFGRDPKKLLLWMWRHLPDRLAAADGGAGPIAARIPADPRLPNLSVWQRMAFDAALAGASPSPRFLVIQVLPGAASLDESATLGDLCSGSSIHAMLSWEAISPIVEELGPEAILSPSLWGHPRVDAWLQQLGITPAEGVDNPVSSPCLLGDLPNVFVALVPAERVQELGEACKKRFDDAWGNMASKVRDHLVETGWADAGDEAWTSIWSRQTARAWEVPWAAVAWGEDSTGAGSLLPKQDVTLLEKWARVQEDAAGLDEHWPGIYYGLWYAGALASAVARRDMGTLSVLCEPDRPCTACGHREALHGDGERRDLDAFWKPIAGPSGKAGGDVAPGEALCAVCAVRRTAAKAQLLSLPDALGQLTDEKGRYALITFALDDPGALLRGGKELKQAATLGDSVHSQLVKPFTKRARSHVKEVLESAAPLGPARQMGIQGAEQDFLTSTLPALLDQHESLAVHASDREVIVAAPATRAYGLAKALRDAMREAFIELPTASGKRLGMHVGPQSTCSAVIAFVPCEEVVGPLVQDCRDVLAESAREQLGGDALVVLQREARVEERLYAAHWDELATSIDAVIGSISEPSQRKRLADALVPVVPALSNPDLDKGSSAARPALVTNALHDAGLSALLEDAASEDKLARAVCQLVDHRVRLSNGTQESHVLDGLRVAASLRGADR
ncbi:MAG: type III-B CRISPR-associated protein Cas10/Cmr2 [Myxococcota bacterium]